jgi:GGDEF domain-containing protein
VRRLRWLFPGAAVLAVTLAFWALGEAAHVRQVSDAYALVLYGVGVVLAVTFRRSRIAIALLALGLVDHAASGAADARLAHGCALLGLLGLLHLTRDRGFFSKVGVIQLGVFAALSAVPAMLLADTGRAEAFQRVELLPAALFGWSGAPPVMVVFGAVSLGLGAWGIYRWGGSVDKGLVWGQLMVLVAIHPALAPPGSSLFMMATGLTLTLSVVESTYAMAYLDELTGLPARRALVNDLGVLGGTYALAMVDIDHFKKLNDKHGHDIGDEVLKLVATLLAKAPGGGRAYRYGGEEFTLLYSGRTSDAARPHLEAVRASIEGARFTLRAWNRPRSKPPDGKRRRRRRSVKLKVTVSLGIAHADGGGLEPKDVLKQADQALYDAKKAGRNRVAVWEAG